MPAFGVAPGLDDIEAIARTALHKLPEPFAGYLRDVVLIVQDFPDDDMLAELGIADPFDRDAAFRIGAVDQTVGADMSARRLESVEVIRRDERALHEGEPCLCWHGEGEARYRQG